MESNERYIQTKEELLKWGSECHWAGKHELDSLCPLPLPTKVLTNEEIEKMPKQNSFHSSVDKEVFEAGMRYMRDLIFKTK